MGEEAWWEKMDEAAHDSWWLTERNKRDEE